MVAFNIGELKNNQHIRQKKKLYSFGPYNMGLRKTGTGYLPWETKEQKCVARR